MPHLIEADFCSLEKSALQREERTTQTTSATAATLKEKAKNNLMINAWPVVLMETKRASSGQQLI